MIRNTLFRIGLSYNYIVVRESSSYVAIKVLAEDEKTEDPCILDGVRFYFGEDEDEAYKQAESWCSQQRKRDAGAKITKIAEVR